MIFVFLSLLIILEQLSLMKIILLQIKLKLTLDIGPNNFIIPVHINNPNAVGKNNVNCIKRGKGFPPNAEAQRITKPKKAQINPIIADKISLLMFILVFIFFLLN